MKTEIIDIAQKIANLTPVTREKDGQYRELLRQLRQHQADIVTLTMIRREIPGATAESLQAANEAVTGVNCMAIIPQVKLTLPDAVAAKGEEMWVGMMV